MPRIRAQRRGRRQGLPHLPAQLQHQRPEFRLRPSQKWPQPLGAGAEPLIERKRAGGVINTQRVRIDQPLDERSQVAPIVRTLSRWRNALRVCSSIELRDEFAHLLPVA